MLLTRTHLARALSAALLCSAAFTAHALDDVKFMVAGTPGGGFDTAARTMGKALQEAQVAKNVTFEYKPGAGGAIGLAQFVNSNKGDPNALIVVSANTVTGILQTKAPVTLAQATPIARVFTEYNVIAVAKDSPYKNLGELIAALKKDPTSIKWAGGSKGSVDHIGVIEMAQAVGVPADKVNYSPTGGGGETAAAVLGEHVTALSGGYPEVSKFVTAGQMRLLAVTSPTRLAGVDVPTLKEQGVDVTTGNFRVYYGAPGITPAQQQALIDAITKATQTPFWQNAVKTNQWTATPLYGKDADSFIGSENARLEKALKLVGLL
ncbi:tripartite tricarboxylate transporter substrate binding protein [Piscinibacter sakaiensis]|uniref:tripartite tricarboxylate transporter substrate binding protein n=1 Tax=Piscinibacter sakaiensis TaxID=1547922 RepID=UPI003AABF329